MTLTRLIVPIALAVVLSASTGCGVRNSRVDSVSLATSANHDRFRGQPALLRAADFLVEAVDSSRMEIEQSRLALEKTEHVEVQEFAERMVADHTALLEETRSLAARLNIEVPPTLSIKNAKEVERLERKSGRSFDKKYIRLMRAAHERDVKAFDRARSVQQPEVRSFAERNLPQLQDHLARIRDIKRDY